MRITICGLWGSRANELRRPLLRMIVHLHLHLHLHLHRTRAAPAAGPARIDRPIGMHPLHGQPRPAPSRQAALH